MKRRCIFTIQRSIIAFMLSSFSAIFCVPAQIAFTAVVTFQNDLDGFQAATGAPLITIDFDDISSGTNIAGTTINGITFTSPSGNTLDVVAGSATFTPSGFFGVINPDTNRLFPTSGTNVLSPGGPSLVPGPNPAQQDSLQLDFGNPLTAFGIDLLFQSLDSSSLTSYQVRDSALNLLLEGSVDFGPLGGSVGDPGGAFFIGFVSDSPLTNFSRIIFTESDGNAIYPDANIGYDTLRAAPVPLPTTIILFGSGLLGILVIGRKTFFKN
ncbi:MAG: PEP-CTERM sorting domain-containing protein [Desulfobacterales bacterium]|nr:MAG: PEP-CTERM sorting domain-containing protein [Desulfobacterales bacterium]